MTDMVTELTRPFDRAQLDQEIATFNLTYPVNVDDALNAFTLPPVAGTGTAPATTTTAPPPPPLSITTAPTTTATQPRPTTSTRTRPTTSRPRPVTSTRTRPVTTATTTTAPLHPLTARRSAGAGTRTTTSDSQSWLWDHQSNTGSSNQACHQNWRKTPTGSGLRQTETLCWGIV